MFKSQTWSKESSGLVWHLNIKVQVNWCHTDSKPATANFTYRTVCYLVIYSGQVNWSNIDRQQLTLTASRAGSHVVIYSIQLNYCHTDIVTQPSTTNFTARTANHIVIYSFQINWYPVYSFQINWYPTESQSAFGNKLCWWNGKSFSDAQCLSQLVYL